MITCICKHSKQRSQIHSSRFGTSIFRKIELTIIFLASFCCKPILVIIIWFIFRPHLQWRRYWLLIAAVVTLENLKIMEEWIIWISSGQSQTIVIRNSKKMLTSLWKSRNTINFEQKCNGQNYPWNQVQIAGPLKWFLQLTSEIICCHPQVLLML